uniref:aldehyde dehydrogenase family protein n=1 Tax=Euzebya sp. TaxID=1971409 RepID=UPI0035148013
MTPPAATLDARFALAVGEGPAPDRPLLPVQDPYRGDTAFWVARASAEDVQSAVRLARAALADPLPAHRRSAVLDTAADLVDDAAEDLTRLLVREAGKPRRAAAGEVARTAETLRWSAGEALRITGEAIPLDAAAAGEGRLAFTLREPVGVVAAITPTNAPLNLAAHKVGPALAAGNAVVLKPPDATPCTALALRDLLLAAGLPAAWFSVVVGGGLGQALVANPDVDLITFTGSVETGRHIRAAAGIRDVMLELGGNSPVIIHADADLDRAVGACTAKGFAGAGQACTSVQRIIAHRDVAEEVARRLVAAVAELGDGDPDDPATTVASLRDDESADRVRSWVAEAVQRGARLLTGGRR